MQRQRALLCVASAEKSGASSSRARSAVRNSRSLLCSDSSCAGRKQGSVRCQTQIAARSAAATPPRQIRAAARLVRLLQCDKRAARARCGAAHAPARHRRVPQTAQRQARRPAAGGPGAAWPPRGCRCARPPRVAARRWWLCSQPAPSRTREPRCFWRETPRHPHPAPCHVSNALPCREACQAVPCCSGTRRRRGCRRCARRTRRAATAPRSTRRSRTRHG